MITQATFQAPLVSSHRPPPRSVKSIFWGPNGLRAGWRMFIFLALFCAMFLGFTIIRSGGVHGFVEAQKRLRGFTLTPLLLGGSEAIAIMFLAIATLVMSKIEHRKLRDYGLPLLQTLGRNFWLGSLLGFLAISGTLLAMFLLHGFRVTGVALHGLAVIPDLFAWGIAFLLSGLFEEFLNRGYLQYTLASSIGFWPAALVFSALFGLGHYFNPGETVIGSISAGSFGLLLCLFLQRTGNLWCAIGFHAGYDWGQTFFYGVPNSAMAPNHNLLHSTLSGPLWLSGGAVGPESSIFCPIVLLAVGLIFSRYYRENRYQMEMK
jgi:uncharacterized protein